MRINQNIAETVGRREADEGKFWKGLMKAAASKGIQEEEIPEFYPLVSPYLDTLSESEKQSAIKQKGAFLAGYYDRRAQANSALDHPESKLADFAPRNEFVSEYADPANPKSKAGLLITVSRGHVQGPGTRLMNRRQQRRGRFRVGGDQSL